MVLIPPTSPISVGAASKPSKGPSFLDLTAIAPFVGAVWPVSHRFCSESADTRRAWREIATNYGENYGDRNYGDRITVTELRWNYGEITVTVTELELWWELRN